MAFRFQRLTTLYPAFVKQLVGRPPSIDKLTYEGLFQRFLDSRFAESDYHAIHMRRLGHVAETQFISVDVLQKKWARERGIGYRESHWQEDIAVAQVERFQPNVIFVDDLYVMDRRLRDRFRQACRREPLVVGWRAAPTTNYEEFDDLDLVLSSIANLTAQFRKAGVRAETIHHGFEASILDAVPATERDVPASFAGGLTVAHRERARLIEHLMAHSDLQVWADSGPRRVLDRVSWGLSRFGIPQSAKARMRTFDLRFPGRIHGPVFGADYYQLLARSKVVLNCHISCARDDASNMRLFEATGMGACLLTDDKPNLTKLFEPDVEVVTYSSAEECAEKLDFLLRNDRQRRDIAEAGQRRTLKEHRFGRRVERLEQVLASYLAAEAA